jgi:hypothetical protein
MPECYKEVDWLLTAILGTKNRLRAFENSMLRGILGPNRDEVTGSGENFIMWSFMICISHPILRG